MHYLLVLGLAILAFYVLSRLIIVAILEPLFALAGSVIAGVIVLSVLGLITAGLYKLGLVLSRMAPKRGGMYAMAFLIVLWIVGFSYFYNHVGKWETHIFTKDVWKPNWIRILIYQGLFSGWTFVGVVAGLEGDKKAQGSSTETSPPC
jgi:hypothetical protein